ncbi:MAG: 2-amino-4-hydroxy-6-hydroxymethyldihydropteridine diphosphokinase [Pseudomonadota bacterium]
MSSGDRLWTPAYLAIGSNLSHPIRQLTAALELLRAASGVRVYAASSAYRSAPLGGIEQPDFLNACVALLTRLSARELLRALQAIEEKLGRDRNVRRWGPRIIDLDLLVFGRERLDEPDLTVPHPGIAARNFVLLPLREIVPDLQIPGLGRVSDLAVPAEPHIARVGDTL